MATPADKPALPPLPSPMEVHGTLADLDKKVCAELLPCDATDGRAGDAGVTCHLASTDPMVMVFDNFLTPDEVETVLTMAEAVPMEVPRGYPAGTRDSTRALVFAGPTPDPASSSGQFAPPADATGSRSGLLQTARRRLFCDGGVRRLESRRLWPVPYGFHNVPATGFDSGGTNYLPHDLHDASEVTDRDCDHPQPWSGVEKLGLNPLVRINRYQDAATGFAWHRDAQFTARAASATTSGGRGAARRVKTGTEGVWQETRAVATLLVYLEAPDEGGETEFAALPAAAPAAGAGSSVAEEAAAAPAAFRSPAARVAPAVGRAVLFDVRALHRALPCRGRKTVLRFDVLRHGTARREHHVIPPHPSDDPAVVTEAKAIALFRQAQLMELVEPPPAAAIAEAYERVTTLRMAGQGARMSAAAAAAVARLLAIPTPITGGPRGIHLLYARRTASQSEFHVTGGAEWQAARWEAAAVAACLLALAGLARTDISAVTPVVEHLLRGLLYTPAADAPGAANTETDRELDSDDVDADAEDPSPPRLNLRPDAFPCHSAYDAATDREDDWNRCGDESDDPMDTEVVDAISGSRDGAGLRRHARGWADAHMGLQYPVFQREVNNTCRCGLGDSSDTTEYGRTLRLDCGVGQVLLDAVKHAVVESRAGREGTVTFRLPGSSFHHAACNCEESLYKGRWMHMSDESYTVTWALRFKYRDATTTEATPGGGAGDKPTKTHKKDKKHKHAKGKKHKHKHTRQQGTMEGHKRARELGAGSTGQQTDRSDNEDGSADEPPVSRRRIDEAGRADASGSGLGGSGPGGAPAATGGTGALAAGAGQGAGAGAGSGSGSLMASPAAAAAAAARSAGGVVQHVVRVLDVFHTPVVVM